MTDHTHSTDYLNGASPAEEDEPEHEALIVPGRGKLEGVSFSSDPRIEAAVREILIGIGEQPEREGLLKTPTRVARMYAELTAGYHVDPEALINDAVFRYGAFLTALITFVTTAAAIFFFVVKPVTALMARMSKPTEEEVTDEERRHQELLAALSTRS